jgi:hypothetical protein
MIGAVEYKLFVGSLNKQASVKEVEEVCCLHQSNCTHYTVIALFKVGQMFLFSCNENVWSKANNVLVA